MKRLILFLILALIPTCAPAEPPSVFELRDGIEHLNLEAAALAARVNEMPIPQPFTATFQDLPLGSPTNDPLVFDKSHFTDGEYRILYIKRDVKKRKLVKTADFLTYTTLSEDWLPSLDVHGGTTFQDHFIRSDGLFVLYQNDGQEGSTAVWTGPDLNSMTRLGQVLSTEGDCGVYYDENNATVHIYTEDADTASGVSSQVISHWTTPADDLLNATKQKDALATPGWGTGDVEVIKVGSTYWMFVDHNIDHPDYRIALYGSDDLYNWHLSTETLTDQSGGDIAMVEVEPGKYMGFTEFSGANTDALGRWILTTDEYDGGTTPLPDDSETTVFPEDTFTDADGTALVNHTMDAGSGWTEMVLNSTKAIVTGSAQVQANAAAINADDNGVWTDAGQGDVIIEVDWTPSVGGDNRYSVVARHSTDGNEWLLNVREENGDVRLLKMDADSPSVVSSTSYSFIEGTTYRLKFECNGTSLRGYVDGVQQLSHISTFNQSAKHVGIVRNSSSETGSGVFDNFLVTVP